MPRTRFHRTAAFRLALLIALLVSLLTLILLALAFWDFSSFARAQLRSTIEHEADQLAKEAEDEGLSHLVEDLRRLEGLGHRQTFAYSLFDSTGVRLIGNISTAPKAYGWIAFDDEASPSVESEHAAVGLAVRLKDGSTLVIARGTEGFDELRERIAKTLSAGAAATVLLALLGGLLIGRRTMQRVETINATASRIISGDLTQRLPKWGSGDEFDRLSDILNAMLQRIERLMHNLKSVSSDIAHDLRTPLARLRQGLESLSSEATTVDDYREGIDKALGEIDQVLETFAALLRIAEVEAGARAAGFREVDLTALCQKLSDVYLPAIEDSHRSFAVSIERGLIARGDPELLTQAIANLIENALRHTPEGARISLRATAAEGASRIVVADNGPGIPEADRGAVIGRFARLDESRSTPGHGLGLALVSAIADLHGARLRLEDNRPGLEAILVIPAANKVNPPPKA